MSHLRDLKIKTCTNKPACQKDTKEGKFLSLSSAWNMAISGPGMVGMLISG